MELDININMIYNKQQSMKLQPCHDQGQISAQKLLKQPGINF